MKYATVALLLLGMISTSEAKVVNALTQVQARNFQRQRLGDSSSDSSSSDDESNLVQLNANAPCEYLDETQDELDYQIDMFSRTLDPRHWTNVVNIAEAMTKKQGLKPVIAKVHTWELYDTAFSFPRVRRYNFVNENMDMLEHFQDNLNTNISNSVHMANFLRVARTVRGNFNEKYHDGEFNDPGNTDPRVAAETPKTWSQL